MSTDELVDVVLDLQQEQEFMDRRMDALQTQLRNIQTVLAGSDDDFHAWARQENEPISTRLDQLDGAIDAATTQSQSGRANGQTKVNLAYEIARDEGVRVSTKSISGGAVDWPTVRDIADREYDTTMNSGTVYAAFDRLADDWACFTVDKGGDGPNTKNKRLICDRDTISESLRASVSTEPN